MEPRSVTIIAVVAGTAIGGGSALLTKPDSRPKVGPGAPSSVARPFRPLASTPPSPPSLPPAANPTAGPTPTARTGMSANPAVTLRPGELTPDERACARGTAASCLTVANTLDRDPDRHKRSITFRRRAVVLYAEGCQARKPGACHALSQLYEKGIGVGKNEDTAAALTQRYLELCKKTPTAPACTPR